MKKVSWSEDLKYCMIREKGYCKQVFAVSNLIISKNKRLSKKKLEIVDK